MIEKVKRTKLIDNGMHIVLGLSGGPDSVCLFDILINLSNDMNLHIHPIHINHKIRVGDADKDQKFVEKLCKKNGLKCEVYEFDCKLEAKVSGQTTEEAGRKVRYEKFIELAEKIHKSGVPKSNIVIATAHNADDQCETILLRLLRGTGIDGIAGIDNIRVDESGYRIIRPLLSVYKDEILLYCTNRNLEPCIDKTNYTTEYARNKVRLELIPYLEKYNSNVKESLLRLAQSAKESRLFMENISLKKYMELLDSEQETEVVFKSAISKLDKIVFVGVVKKAFAKLGLYQDIESVHYNNLWELMQEEKPSGWVDFPRGYRGERQYGKLRLSRQKVEEKYSNFEIKIRIEDVNISEGKINNEVLHTKEVLTFDYDVLRELYGEKVRDLITIRTRGPGDFISIGSGRKKIQNLFVDEKIPRSKREEIFMICIGNEILAIPMNNQGLRRSFYSKNFSVSKKTKLLLIVEIISAT